VTKTIVWKLWSVKSIVSDPIDLSSGNFDQSNQSSLTLLIENHSLH